MRAALLIALVACGDNVPPDPNVAQSGSRIRLIQYDYGDGAREYDTMWFHDAARGERCRPVVWSDGVTLCTPSFATAVFTSADCTEAIGQVPVGAPMPAYIVREFWLAGRLLPSRIFDAGLVVPAPAETWLLRGSACDGPYDASGSFYVALGAEVPRDALARITHPEVVTASRLQLEVVASADGLYAPIGIFDRERDAPCTPLVAPGEPTAACLSSGVADAEYYHDAACAEPELAVATGARMPSVVRHHDARTGCTSYHDIGREVSAPPLFHRNGPSCVAITAPIDTRYVLAGAAADVAVLDRERDTAPRRIHPITLAHESVRFPDVLLHDEVLGTECRRAELAGATRCLPVTSTPVIERFDSDGCQTTVALAEVRTGECRVPAVFAIDPAGAFRRVGAIHSAPLFHLSTGDRCLPYEVPAGIELRDVGRRCRQARSPRHRSSPSEHHSSCAGVPSSARRTAAATRSTSAASPPCSFSSTCTYSPSLPSA